MPTPGNLPALNRNASGLRPSPLAKSASSTSSELPTPSDAPKLEPKLSGKIISATCFTPFTIGYRRKPKDGSRGATSMWELTPRRGSSALIDTLRHIAAKDSGWDHAVVGWTGEIQEMSARAGPLLPQGSRAVQVNGGRQPPLGPRSRSYYTPPPVPVFGGTNNRMTMKADCSRDRPEEEQVPCVDKVKKEDLQRVLAERSREDGWNKVRAVWLGDEEDRGVALTGMDRWVHYAEKVLWPTFHYIIPQTFPLAENQVLQEKVWWNDYLSFNNAYADEIIQLYTPGDIIWIHDYHLLILPEILRQRLGNDVHIGLFVHSPWPTSEIFKILSRRRELLKGMLAANMVGFQSETYRDHFVSCCKRILGLEESKDADGNFTGVDTSGSHCAVHALPIGIDYLKVKASAAVTDPEIKANMDKIKNGYGDRKIIVGRDRLDSVRGVLQKLRAFERFLEDNPDWVDKVVLIQLTSPSSLTDSQAIETKVSELVSKINGRFGSLHYSPVQHYPQYLEPQEYFALLRVADLGLITSVRDGMNTASLEYIICQENSYGPVILSEFTGTAESLKDAGAIRVNPTNTVQVSREIARCLEMPEAQKRALHARLYEYVTTNTSQDWDAKFLHLLFGELVSSAARLKTPLLDNQRLLKAYSSKKERIFMFDYDGTLAPIVEDPNMAIPADRVVRTLKRLAQAPGNTVWIISGRDQEFLSEHLGHIEELGLSAEHGCFLRYPNRSEWENLAEKIDMGWQAIAESVFQRYTEQTSGSHIEKKSVAVTWHYRRADDVLGKHNAQLCRDEMERALAAWPVEVMEGKANLEVRPQALNKGEIVRMLVGESRREDGRGGFVFCAGDDRTDEDMFRVLKELKAGDDYVFTVTVGPSSKATDATWHVLEPSDIVDSAGLCVGIVDLQDVGAAKTRKEGK